jgi:polyribonucleotide nucleotidyltransferase
VNIPTGHRYTTLLGGRELVIETGKYAKQASGSVTVRMGDTLLLVTAQMSDEKSNMGFLPLTVEYEERHYAIGKIPGSFQRREGRPGIQGTLNARLIDRQIRPLFPKGLRNEVQVIATVLSADQKVDPGPLGAIGAAAALALSDIPWGGPVACTHVAFLGGDVVIAPSLQQLADPGNQLELTVAVSRDAVLMVEAAADELPEGVMVDAIEAAQRALAPVVALIERMRSELGAPKQAVEPVVEVSADDVAEITAAARAAGLREALLTVGKHERATAVKGLRNQLIAERVPDAQADGAAERIASLKGAFSKAESAEMRRMVVEERIRTDGRAPDGIRPIWIETGVLPTAHGSAVFTRGETQVLGVATLGTGRDNRLVDDLGIEATEDFMLHYNFPPYSTGEAKRMRGVGRRELGHGNLAKRALARMMPGKDSFPYVVRVVGETFESNGSSSMATVCAGSLSLMDAGVPLRKPVAGIAMGLVMEGDRYAVLSDILGSEDALGDMDFKVCGTRDGVTALQMDIKITGITPTLMREALAQARAGRLHILTLMDAVLPAPRGEVSPRAPRIVSVRIPSDKIGSVIGPGGKNIRELESLGAKVEIEEDGHVRIYAEVASVAEEVRERIRNMTATAELGKIYDGVVAKIVDFGAFITLFPGTDGLLHISQMAEGRVENVADVVREGDRIRVKVNGIDERGKIDLIRPELEGLIAPRRPAGPRRDGDRGPRRDGDRGPRRDGDRGPRGPRD